LLSRTRAIFVFVIINLLYKTRCKLVTRYLYFIVEQTNKSNCWQTSNNRSKTKWRSWRLNIALYIYDFAKLASISLIRTNTKSKRDCFWHNLHDASDFFTLLSSWSLANRAWASSSRYWRIYLCHWSYIWIA